MRRSDPFTAVGYGDSGGPNFLGDDRLDTESARAVLDNFVELP